MTARIAEPNLYHTETLMTQVLQHIQHPGARVAFLCDAGDGDNVIQRIRVMISRKRKELKRRGKKVKEFRLHATVHKETHDGKRHDCIVMWKSVNEIHIMSEELEDMLSNG